MANCEYQREKMGAEMDMGVDAGEWSAAAHARSLDLEPCGTCPACEEERALFRTAMGAQVRAAMKQGSVALVTAAIRMYTGRDEDEIAVEVVQDPHCAAAWAAQATFPDMPGQAQQYLVDIDLLRRMVGDRFVDEAVFHSVEEVEYTAWPPTSGRR